MCMLMLGERRLARFFLNIRTQSLTANAADIQFGLNQYVTVLDDKSADILFRHPSLFWYNIKKQFSIGPPLL